jgi:hypothetical protein
MRTLKNLKKRGYVATWHPEFKREVVIDRIEKNKKIDSNGQVSIHGFEFSEYTSILGSMIHFNREIPELERRKIINQSIFAAATKVLMHAELIAEITKREKSYLATPKTRFRLVTSISMQHPKVPLLFRFKETELSFGWRQSKTISTARNIVLDQERNAIDGGIPNFYESVSVLVSARTKNEAAELALDKLDLIRGIWNFWKNRATWIRRSSGSRTPVNSIILGPIHTLHTPSGTLATENWWYESSYRGSVNVYKDGTRVEKMVLFTKLVRSHLRRIPYRETVESAIIRYSRALDSRDWNYAFLQLWSIIELLTGTTANESHKTTMKRAASTYKADDEYLAQSLIHLRMHRNNAVHTGEEVENVEPLMYQAKNIVEHLIEFHLSHSGKFKKLVDVSEFLDSADTLDKLDERIRKLQLVRSYVAS